MLGHYWGEILGKKRMLVGQLSERGSEFTVDTRRNRHRPTLVVSPVGEEAAGDLDIGHVSALDQLARR